MPTWVGSRIVKVRALVGALFEARLIHDVGQYSGPFRQQGFAVFHHEAACDDVGDAFEHAGLLVDGDDRHDESVFSEVTAIAEHFVADLAGPRAEITTVSSSPILTDRKTLVEDARWAKERMA